MPKFSIYKLLIVFLLLLTSGCSAYSSDMSGTVVDAETGKPIEGAVVLVEWTKKRGIGGSYHTESVKIEEMLTDKDGKFAVSGMSDPFVNTPDLTVYKKGYICWNNKYIFPNEEQRVDFHWGREVMIRLSTFSADKYTYSSHVMFIHNSMHAGNPLGSKKLMKSAIRWEELISVRESSQTK